MCRELGGGRCGLPQNDLGELHCMSVGPVRPKRGFAEAVPHGNLMTQGHSGLVGVRQVIWYLHTYLVLGAVRLP